MVHLKLTKDQFNNLMCILDEYKELKEDLYGDDVDTTEVDEILNTIEV